MKINRRDGAGEPALAWLGTLAGLVWGMPLVLMQTATAGFDSTRDAAGAPAISAASLATLDLGGLGIGSAPLHAAFGAAHEGNGDPAAPEEARPAFGAADSLRLNLIGGVVSNFSNTTGGTARLEFEYFMADRISIVPVAELGWLAQDDADDALLAGGAVLLRWHVVHRADWTIFADAGVGLLYAGAEVPLGTNRIKFAPQIGGLLIGCVLDFSETPSQLNAVLGKSDVLCLKLRDYGAQALHLDIICTREIADAPGARQARRARK